MTLCSVSSELLIFRQPNLVWWYMIISMRFYSSIIWTSPVRVKNKGKWNVKMSIFIQIISSKAPNILLPNLEMWCIIMSWRVMLKDWFGIFKVKVTISAHMMKIWQLLLYLLKCWSFCYQTLFDSTFLSARMSYEEMGLLYSRSRSQQKFKKSLNVSCLSRRYFSFDSLNRLLPTLV